MARSARSKSRLRAKSIKVTAKNGDYHKTEEERRQRIAKKMAENDAQHKQKEAAEKMDEDGEAKKEAAELDIDPAKVKTHGWRKTRKAQRKQRKVKNKKNKTMRF